MSGNRKPSPKPEPPERLNNSSTLTAVYLQTREQTMSLCAPLSAEDCQLQSAPNCSPVKWHLAHTNWFFDHFLLKRCPDANESCALFHTLYNSYYHTAGRVISRSERGLISRPSLERIKEWRCEVDELVLDLLANRADPRLLFITRLGIEHERQHQELILMDIKHHFFANPGFPAYTPAIAERANTSTAEMVMRAIEPDPSASIGRDGVSGYRPEENFIDPRGFAYDNETPRHSVRLAPFKLADRLISNRHYLDFIQDQGYQRVELWLSDGWDWVRSQSINAPLYWRRQGNEWSEFRLSGMQELDLDAPVCHINFYEACAFAEWAGKRLPTEFELEWVMTQEFDKINTPLSDGNFLESGYLHPIQSERYCGNLWQWTRSAYAPYPDFKPLMGSIGEYNGKFMVNQQVLRGGSCISPKRHFHPSRRNFFYPNERWAFTGLRLAI